MDLINRWKAAAEKKGLTMVDLAELADVDRSLFERWKLKLPKALKAYFSIEKALKQELPQAEE